MGRVSRPPARALLVDALLALVLAAVTAGYVTRAPVEQIPPLPHRALDPLALGLMAVAACAPLVRRVWPLGTLAVTVAASTAYVAATYPYGPILLAVALAMYTVAARAPVRRSATAVALAVVALLGGHAAGFTGDDLLAQLLPWLVGVSWWLLAPWAVGIVVGFRRQAADRGREEEARRRADQERLRIAREVHDVVGHGLAVINMQSGVALHVLDRRPEQARPALEAIKKASKESLDELRGTLAVFRQPAGAGEAAHGGHAGAGTTGSASDSAGDSAADRASDRAGDDAVESLDGAPRRPLPGLGQLDTLLAAMRDGGLTVDLDVTGERVALPAAADLAAYRIVQESLTNVLRHAGTASARVRLVHEPHAVVLEITDDGHAGATGSAGHPGTPGPTGQMGHGIAGMRERAAALGGTLEAGPRAEGGFRVHARLPIG